jgi:hypothetical protein
VRSPGRGRRKPGGSAATATVTVTDVPTTGRPGAQASSGWILWSLDGGARRFAVPFFSLFIPSRFWRLFFSFFCGYGDSEARCRRRGSGRIRYPSFDRSAGGRAPARRAEPEPVRNVVGVFGQGRSRRAGTDAELGSPRRRHAAAGRRAAPAGLLSAERTGQGRGPPF